MANYGKHGTIKFDKMWAMMERVHIKKADLRNAGVHANTISKLVKNENVTTEVISHLCEILHCQPSDIMEYVPRN